MRSDQYPSLIYVCLLPVLLLMPSSFAVQAKTYEFCEVKKTRSCSEKGQTRYIDGIPVYADCWKWTEAYTCFEKPATDCSAADSALPREAYTVIGEKSKTGRLVDWTEKKQYQSACRKTVNTQYGCTDWYDRDDGDPATPDPQAITCLAAPKKTCEPSGCRVITQTCTHYVHGICDQEVIRYSCGNASVCNSAEGLRIKGDTESNFNQAIAANSLLDVIAASGTVDRKTGEIRLFEGKHQNCKYVSKEWSKAAAVNGVAITALAYYFGGPLGMASAPVSAYVGAIADDRLNCCDRNPDRIDPGKSLNFCKMDDKQLAIARRTKRAVQLGSKIRHTCFCTDRAGLNIYTPLSIRTLKDTTGDCSELCNNPFARFPPQVRHYPGVNLPTADHLGLSVEEPQSWKKHYCVFDDMLSRIIQQQGREQINQMMDSAAAVDMKSLTLAPAYTRQTAGWSGASSLQGNLVAFWSWSSQCMNRNYSGGVLSQAMCPAVPGLFVAICSLRHPDECGMYPKSPLEPNEHWDIAHLQVDDFDHHQTLNSYASARAYCNKDNRCRVQINAWPAGVGAQVMQKINLVWQPRFPMDSKTGAKYSWDVFSSGSALLEVKMRTTIDQATAASAPLIRVRKTGEKTWQEIQLPEQTDTSRQYRLRDGSVISASGSCNRLFCKYILSRKVTLKRKPWFRDIDGGYRDFCLVENPLTKQCLDHKRKFRRDTREGLCKGFTLDEFSVLDMRKMDLGEYTRTLSNRASNTVLKWIDSHASP